RVWCAEMSEVPHWLFEESYHIVGDLAETIAKLLPPPLSVSSHSLSYWMEYILALQHLSHEERKSRVLDAWNQLEEWDRFIFNKMMMGAFRMGVSQKLVTRALSRYSGKEENEIAHRLMGKWDPLQQ